MDPEPFLAEHGHSWPTAGVAGSKRGTRRRGTLLERLHACINELSREASSPMSRNSHTIPGLQELGTLKPSLTSHEGSPGPASFCQGPAGFPGLASAANPARLSWHPERSLSLGFSPMQAAAGGCRSGEAASHWGLAFPQLSTQGKRLCRDRYSPCPATGFTAS